MRGICIRRFRRYRRYGVNPVGGGAMAAAVMEGAARAVVMVVGG